MELKPCPFCGGEAITEMNIVRWESFGAATTTFRVRCKNNYCCCRGTSAEIKDTSFEVVEAAMKEAIEAWNRRADNG